MVSDADLVTDATGSPLPHSLRDGSEALPFLDLRDALLRARELSAPFIGATVTIYLAGLGSHFVPLEEDSD